MITEKFEDYNQATPITADFLNKLVGAVNGFSGADGSLNLGYLPPGLNRTATTAQRKFEEQPNLNDFFVAGENDHTGMMQRAAVSGNERVRIQGKVRVSDIIPVGLNPIVFTGDGRKAEITFTSSIAAIKAIGTFAQRVEAVEFESITFTGTGFEGTPHIFLDWARQIKFNKCFFYHCSLSANHMNFWNITDCELYDSDIVVQYTRNMGEGNEVSGAPRCTSSFFSNSAIDLTDCVDLMMVNCHMFQKGVKSRLLNLINEGGDPSQAPKSTYFISNCIFDSIYGLAWDLWDVAGCSIMGNFVSSGRDQSTDGAQLYRGWHNKIVGNTFLYCGAWGLTLENCQETMVTSNTFVGNRTGGLRTVNHCVGILITANIFGVNPSIYGAPYVAQPVGYSDASSDGVGIRVVGNRFRPGDMATPLYLPVTVANRNLVQGNEGVLDTLGADYRGSTAERPTGAVIGYGPFFDTTLGKPIWSLGGGVWHDAVGAAV